MSLSEERVIERLCSLSGEVARRRFGWSRASDCFCKRRNPPIGNWSYEEEVLAFIENAVRESLDKIEPVRPDWLYDK